MPRYKLTIEYDGRPFVGWQIQDNGASVQARWPPRSRLFAGEAERARAPGAPTPACMHSGRSHMSISPKTGIDDTVRDALNAHLRPHPVAILAAERVDADDFDARFSAMRRHYLYRIVNRRADLDARARPRLARCRAARRRGDARGGAAPRRPARLHHLPHRRMPGEIPVKTLDQLDVHRATATRSTSSPRRARSCTTRCARWSARWRGRRGQVDGDDLAAALARRDRAACAPVAPPDGLYLARVDYRGRAGARTRTQPKYRSSILRYTAVSVCEIGDARSRSSTCACCAPTRPNSSTGQ